MKFFVGFLLILYLFPYNYVLCIKNVNVRTEKINSLNSNSMLVNNSSFIRDSMNTFKNYKQINSFEKQKLNMTFLSNKTNSINFSMYDNAIFYDNSVPINEDNQIINYPSHNNSSSSYNLKFDKRLKRIETKNIDMRVNNYTNFTFTKNETSKFSNNILPEASDTVYLVDRFTVEKLEIYIKRYLEFKEFIKENNRILIDFNSLLGEVCKDNFNFKLKEIEFKKVCSDYIILLKNFKKVESVFNLQGKEDEEEINEGLFKNFLSIDPNKNGFELKVDEKLHLFLKQIYKKFSGATTKVINNTTNFQKNLDKWQRKLSSIKQLNHTVSPNLLIEKRKRLNNEKLSQKVSDSTKSHNSYGKIINQIKTKGNSLFDSLDYEDNENESLPKRPIEETSFNEYKDQMQNDYNFKSYKNSSILNADNKLKACERKFLNFRLVLSNEKSRIELEKLRLKVDLSKKSQELWLCKVENKKITSRFDEFKIENYLKIQSFKKQFEQKLKKCNQNNSYSAFLLTKCQNEIYQLKNPQQFFNEEDPGGNNLGDLYPAKFFNNNYRFSFLEEMEKLDSYTEELLAEKIKRIKDSKGMRFKENEDSEEEDKNRSENQKDDLSNFLKGVEKKSKEKNKENDKDENIDIDENSVPLYLKRLENPLFLQVKKMENVDKLTKKAKANFKKEKAKNKFKEYLRIEELKLEVENRANSEANDLEEEKKRQEKMKELHKYFSDPNNTKLNNDLCWDLVFDVIWTKIKK